MLIITHFYLSFAGGFIKALIHITMHRTGFFVGNTGTEITQTYQTSIDHGALP